MSSTAKPPEKEPLSAQDSEALLAIIRTALEDRKGRDIQVLDVSERSGFADYFVIVTGTSARHVSAIADHLQEQVKHAGYPRPGVEGAEAGDWILLDMGGIVVHVMRAEVRAFYNLEELWTDLLSDSPGPGPDSASGG